MTQLHLQRQRYAWRLCRKRRSWGVDINRFRYIYRYFSCTTLVKRLWIERYLRYDRHRHSESCAVAVRKETDYISENGSGNAVGLLSEIERTVTAIISAEKSKDNRVKVTRKESLGNCPRCGQSVVENSKEFTCSAGRERCGFFIWGQDKRIGRRYTAAEISEQLSSGKVTLKNCTSSKGNKYSAVFALEDTGQYVNLKLVEFVGGKKRGA